MDVLDEQGRLFGRVNVIDALVVLFALAVIVAGAALVFGDTNDQPEPDPESAEPPARTMYVTVVTGGAAPTTLTPGEVHIDGTPGNITDVYRTPGPRTYLRLELNGTDTEDGFRYGGNPVRLGRGLTISTDELRTNTRVTDRDTAETFATGTTSVTLAATVRRPIADAVTDGDRQFVGETPVATVDAVDRSAVNETHSALEVTLSLETRPVDGADHYGGRPVRLGRTLRFVTDTYEFVGDVIQRTRLR